ncbi:MAG: toxin TcdB middle/N-terminal domain-containing protein, partial [Owenweeksia sp.]
AVFGDPGSTSLTLGQAAANHSFPATALDNGDIYVEFFAPNRRLAELLESKVQAYLYEVVDGREDPESRVEVEELNIFFQERSEFNDYLLGWGQFCWSNLSQNAIPTGKMKQDRSLAENNDYSEGNPPSTSSLDNNQALQDMNPMEQEFWPLTAVRGERPMVNGTPVNTAGYADLSRLDRWSVLGTYVATYNDDGLTVPGKFGEEPKTPQILAPASPGTFGAMATLQYSKSFTLAQTAGPSIPGIGVSYVHSSTINDQNKYYSESQTSFMDINGDAYPDIVTGFAGVDALLTDPQGGHRSTSENVASGQLTKAVTDNQADVVSGTFVNDDPRFLNMKTSVSAGASVSMGETETITEWMDLNGDGLTDRIIKQSSSSVGLELNKGGSLLPAVPLTSTGSQLSDNLTIGLNAGLGALENNESGLGLSFSGGIGINKVGGESKKMYMDMNGDGLTDLIEESGSSLKLSLNNGTSFQLYSSANLSQIEELNKSAGLGVSGNIAGSFAFPLGSFLFFHFKMAISGNVQANYATNNQLSAFRDMNGDGVVDYIRDEDGGLNIYLSKVGKSNLLKKVTNPLKGSFVIDYERKGNRYGAYPVEVPIHTTVEDEEMIWDMPNSKWVMKSLVVDDGLHMENSSNEDIDGWDDMEFTFRYDGGIKSRREREFLGFTRVEKNNRPNRDDIPVNDPSEKERKFWIAEVSDYFRPNKNDPGYRKRFEYMKGLSPDNY